MQQCSLKPCLTKWPNKSAQQISQLPGHHNVKLYHSLGGGAHAALQYQIHLISEANNSETDKSVENGISYGHSVNSQIFALVKKRRAQIFQTQQIIQNVFSFLTFHYGHVWCFRNERILN